MKNLYLICALMGIIQFSSAQNIINAYARISNINNRILTINSTQVDETNDTFEVGEQIIIIQTQEEITYETNNDSNFGNISDIKSAGLYELRSIANISKSGGQIQSITLGENLNNTYNASGNNVVQIISFPNMNDGSGNYTSTNDLTARPWDGNIGGILAFNVTGDFTLNHNLSVDGLGFRGGETTPNSNGDCSNDRYEKTEMNSGKPRDARKGEGIYPLTSLGNLKKYARGKIANAGGGGNLHNAGGGGGGNYAAGGKGGPGWEGTPLGHCNPGAGGVGGVSLKNHINTSERIFFGGGGGAGNQNNNLGTAGSNGGGIILIKASKIIVPQNNNISANGTDITQSAGQDGSGGGGAGGSIILQIPEYEIANTATLGISTNGGKGGDVNHNATHGGGGGGGQGLVKLSVEQAPNRTNIETKNGLGGNNSTKPNDIAETGGTYDGTSHDNGIKIGETNTPLPIQLIEFSAKDFNGKIQINWTTATEINNAYFQILYSLDLSEWNTLSTIEGKGTDYNVNNYQIYDNKQYNTKVYYMLKQVDFDETASYSQIICFNPNNKEDKKFIQLYPNPITEGFLNIFTKKEIEKISLYTLTGSCLFTKTVNRESNTEKLNLENLSKGIYILKINTINSDVITKKIVLK